MVEKNEYTIILYVRPTVAEKKFSSTGNFRELPAKQNMDNTSLFLTYEMYKTVLAQILGTLHTQRKSGKFVYEKY